MDTDNFFYQPGKTMDLENDQGAQASGLTQEALENLEKDEFEVGENFMDIEPRFSSGSQTKEQLHEELEQMAVQWKRQKDLKEMFIKREKEAKRELARLVKYTDPWVLSNARIAHMISNEIRRKKKKDLQNDFEELKTAFIVNNNKHQAELESLRQANKSLKEELQGTRDSCLWSLSSEQLIAKLEKERDRNKHLYAELEKLARSYNEISACYQAEVVDVRQQVSTLQLQLEKEIQEKAALQNRLVLAEMEPADREQWSGVRVYVEKESS